MAVKARKAVKRQKKVPKKRLSEPKETVMVREKWTPEEHLELMIKFTKRAIGETYKDKGMVAQLERLESQLSELRDSK